MHKKFSFKFITLILLCAYPLLTNAQTEKAQNHLSLSYKLENQTTSFTALQANAESIARQLGQQIIKDERIELSFLEKKESAYATHFHYAISYKNIPIYKAHARASLYAKQKVRASIPVINTIENPMSAGNPEGLSVPTYLQPLGPKQDIWYPVAEGLLSAQIQEVLIDSGIVARLVYQNGQLIEMEDERHFNKDTLVSALVYNPDPLTTANTFYGGAFSDNNDANNPNLDSERQAVTVKAHFSNGIFSLENSFVEIVDRYAPSFTPAMASTPSFNFNRSEPGFEDVNTIYHITQYGNYLQSLNYNLPGFKLSADAHGYTIDQSSYSSRFKELRFGDGGVDDAEDADVIVHEFFHAVIDGANVNTGRSIERRCLEEALCDYAAQSYSKALMANQTDKVFNWDGHNEFWRGRNATSQKNYNQVAFTSIYAHTDLWVDCLQDLETSIGQNATHKLVLETIYSLTANQTYREFAYNMLLNDSIMNNGNNFVAIHNAFKRRQVLPLEINLKEHGATGKIAVFNSAGFAFGQPLLVSSQEKLAQLEILNLNGEIIEKVILNGQKEFSYQNSAQPAGLYLLKIVTQQGSVKVVKLLTQSK
jgi:hypothetical protein